MFHEVPRRLLAILTAATLAAAPVRAHAEESPRIKLAVLDVNATGNLPQKEVEGLSALIASEVLAASGGDVIAGADIRSMIGYEKQRAILGCSDTGCLAEIGGALGADYIVGSEVSVVGSTYLLSLSLVDIQRARVVSRLTKTTRQNDDLVPMTGAAVRELLAALPRAQPAAAASPAPAPEAAPAVTATAPDGGRSSMPALVLIGLGSAAFLGGGLLLLDAAKKRSDYLDATDETPTLNEPDADELREKGQASRNLGYTGLGAGVLLGVVGVLLLPRGEKDPKVSVAPERGGALISASVALP